MMIASFLREEEGTAMIEFSLIMTVMVILLLAALDFALLLNQDLRLVDSARTAAETASVRAYATNLSLVNLVGTSSTPALPGYTITSVNYCSCANGVGVVSCSNHTNCGSYGIPNQYVKVTVTAALPLLFGLNGFPATYNVQSVAIARVPWTGTY